MISQTTNILCVRVVSVCDLYGKKYTHNNVMTYFYAYSISCSKRIDMLCAVSIIIIFITDSSFTDLFFYKILNIVMSEKLPIDDVNIL